MSYAIDLIPRKGADKISCGQYGVCRWLTIEHACKLLAYSGMTISQVAYESGYNSLTHFIAQFERHTKRKPSAYRAQIKL